MKKQLDFIMQGGLTKRYHTVDTIKEQNVAEHSFFVMWLLCLMYSEQTSTTQLAMLLICGLTHDIAEGHVGDVSSPVKRAMPELKAFLDVAEDEALNSVNIANAPKHLTHHDKRMLKMADNMEGMLFCCRERYKGNKNIIEVYDNFKAYTLALKPQDKELEIFNLIQEYWNVATAHGQ